MITTRATYKQPLKYSIKNMVALSAVLSLTGGLGSGMGTGVQASFHLDSLERVNSLRCSGIDVLKIARGEVTRAEYSGMYSCICSGLLLRPIEILALDPEVGGLPNGRDVLGWYPAMWSPWLGYSLNLTRCTGMVKGCLSFHARVTLLIYIIHV